MSKIFRILRKLLVAAFLIYGYNVLAQPLNLLIPLNILTIGYVGIFGVPGLISLIIILMYAF